MSVREPWMDYHESTLNPGINGDLIIELSDRHPGSLWERVAEGKTR